MYFIHWCYEPLLLLLRGLLLPLLLSLPQQRSNVRHSGRSCFTPSSSGCSWYQVSLISLFEEGHVFYTSVSQALENTLVAGTAHMCRTLLGDNPLILISIVACTDLMSIISQVSSIFLTDKVSYDYFIIFCPCNFLYSYYDLLFLMELSFAMCSWDVRWGIG